jgi:transcriptional regulator GlxA family with amidase domain
MPSGPSRIGVLLYEGCFASEALAILDLLTLANRVAEHSGTVAPFLPTLHAARPGTVRAAGGASLQAARIEYGLDLLVVPGFDLDPSLDVADRLVALAGEAALVRRAHARGLPVASVCVGAFVLGEAGLLDRRRATTAWLFADRLAQRYPRSVVERDAMLVEDGPVTTTGAFSAATDLALHLVRTRTTATLANRTARIALAAPGRTSQAPFVDEALRDRAKGEFSATVRRYLLSRLTDEYDLGALAATHFVSTRTMLRRFRAETGQTPLDFLQSARVSRAKSLLETTEMNVAEVAAAVGYRDTSTFRRLFTGSVGMTPSGYRGAFGRR